MEAIRTLMVAKRSAAGERTRTINQARALIVTGPDDLRARFAAHTPAALVAGLASLRPRPGGDVAGHATRVALRELGRRAQFLDSQLERLDELIVPLVTAHAPRLLALYGVGPNTAALLLIAAGDHPGRLRSEAAWASLAPPGPARRGQHALAPLTQPLPPARQGTHRCNPAPLRHPRNRSGQRPGGRAVAESGSWPTLATTAPAPPSRNAELPLSQAEIGVSPL